MQLEAIIDTIDEIYKYRYQKKIYECECLIREKQQELRMVQYRSIAEYQRECTIELHRCKRKLERLKEKINNTSDDYKHIWEMILPELEQKLELARKARKDITKR